MSIAYNNRKKDKRNLRQMIRSLDRNRAIKKAFPYVSADIQRFCRGEIARTLLVSKLVHYEGYGLNRPTPLMNEVMDMLCATKTMATQHTSNLHITEKEYKWTDDELKVILSPLIDKNAS